MMIDGTFIIGSALCPLTNLSPLLHSHVGSLYSDRERLEQTFETIDSIDKYCPNNIKYLFDCSPNLPSNEYFDLLRSKNVNVVYVGQDSEVKKYSEMGKKSVAESIGFSLFLDWYKINKVETQRIYKISGRYKLNHNFILNNLMFKDSFVFLASIESHLPKEKQIEAGVERLYSTRLFHLDYNYLEILHEKLQYIINDCKIHDLNVEHSYYKNLHTQNIVELEKIGVTGNTSAYGIGVEE